VPVLALLFAAGTLVPAADKAADPADAARVTAVRFWSLGETTRIAIEVSSEFRYKSERLAKPDRLYFDIFGAKPDMAPHGIETIPVDDAIVRKLRVAQTQPGVTRVVIDLKQSAEMTTSELTNPNRLMIEVKSEGAKSAVGEISESGSKSTPMPPASGGRKLRETAPQPLAAPDAPSADKPLATAPAPSPTPASRGAKSKSAEIAAKTAASKAAIAPITSTTPQQAASVKPPVASSLAGTATPAKSREDHAPEAISASAAAKAPSVAASLPPEPLGVEPPASAEDPKYDVKEDARDDIKEVLPAKRGSSPERSLTRALGLKLGRVVIDPGHGGNDVGTHGPSGYLEKDLTLDVSKRLAALVKENMGSEVVLTRTEDVYVGLEERTRIANERKADLFLSVHANSSPYRSAAGVETYVLSFTTSKAAMDLASRENAGSQLSIHDLQELLQKIALRDKIEESHELAARLQTSLSMLSTKSNDVAKNRGVRKAPFVVLIGASMPSVLAEIGFLTNSGDEALLRKPEHRQKIAEALYRGMSSYADTLSQVVARKN
jgi:N-acetylmuramoyl-L-alanine amidase